MGMPEEAAGASVERAAAVCVGCGLAFPKGLLTRCPRDGGKLERAPAREFHALIGRVLASRYRVLYELGRGSMATVFGAEHTAIERPVALKVLDPAQSRRQEVVLRFQREARASSRIESPHVVTLLDFGAAEDGLLYLAMELLEGHTLSAEMREHGIVTWQEAVRIGRDVAVALAVAHAAGVVHRDLKPDNVMLCGSKRLVKVLDFGIAKIVQADDAAPGAKLTVVGALVGTPGYMSPEAISHAPVGPATDLYSLGVTLFELLAGRPPFVEPARAALLAHHLTTPAPRLSTVAAGRAIPPHVDDLVAALLAKRPDERPPDAITVARSLSDVLGERLPDVLGRGSMPPEGESASSLRPTVRVDLDEMPEEVRPTLRLAGEPAMYEPAGAGRRLMAPAARRRRGARSGFAIALVVVGALAVLALSTVLVSTWLSRRNASAPEPNEPSGATETQTDVDPSRAITTPRDAVEPDAGSTQPGASTPPPASGSKRPAAGAPRPPTKRGGAKSGGRALDIVREYP